jgi:ComF family protein
MNLERWSGIGSVIGRARQRARAEWRELDAAFYPPLCWLCRAEASVDGLGCARHALASCRFDPAEPRCAGCADRLPTGIATGLCASCRRTPRGYRRLVAGGPYRRSAALAEWILAFKHGGRAELARPLAAFLAQVFEEAEGVRAGAVLVGVPLHPWRRFERGYDQAHGLGRELGERLGLELVAALRRTRWTPPQGSRGIGSRAGNVAEAFSPVRRYTSRIAGREVWLVDDVVTSGATLRACAAALRAAGAREVSALALARVERGGEPDAAPVPDDESAD